jgi:hypothetical protein
LADDRNVFIHEELLHNKRCVAQCIIMMHKQLTLPLVALLCPNCIALPLQNLHIEITSSTMSRLYGLMVHQIVDVKEFQDVYDWPSYIPGIMVQEAKLIRLT